MAAWVEFQKVIQGPAMGKKGVWEALGSKSRARKTTIGEARKLQFAGQDEVREKGIFGKKNYIVRAGLADRSRGPEKN